MNDDTTINTLTLQIQPVFIQAIGDHIIERLKPIIGKMKQEDDTIFDVKSIALYLHVDENWIYQRTRRQEIPLSRRANIVCLGSQSSMLVESGRVVNDISSFTPPKKK